MVGMGFVRGTGVINSRDSQVIQRPFSRQVRSLFANRESRGRVIRSKILVARAIPLNRLSTIFCENSKRSILSGSQGTRRPKAICTDRNRLAVPSIVVSPGGMGSRNGKISRIMASEKPCSEVSCRTSRRVSGWGRSRSKRTMSS